jgi:hypothetical protein
MASSSEPGLIHAPISVGDLIDKITILEIKAERIADLGKLANVTKELGLLRAIAAEAGIADGSVGALVRELKAVNGTLWDIEDEIRELEARAEFGSRFVELARGVYRNNDRRAALKRKINEALGSTIVEEKSYKGA